MVGHKWHKKISWYLCAHGVSLALTNHLGSEVLASWRRPQAICRGILIHKSAWYLVITLTSEVGVTLFSLCLDSKSGTSANKVVLKIVSLVKRRWALKYNRDRP